jgi:adenosylcobinamide kinase/adenosylcobinamide-phosphate guanylyltransferase
LKLFVSGGCKNGKTSFAEDWAVAIARGKPHYYIATMIPGDEEDLDRIRKHIASRSGKGFETVECGRNVLEGIRGCDPSGVFLLDSVTALLTNEMYRSSMDGFWTDHGAPERVARELGEFCDRVEHAVFVSDYIFSADEDYNDFTEEYRAGLALCDRTLARRCDTVVDMCVAQPMIIKGELPK